MFQFNILPGSNNFYSFEAIINYLGKKDDKIGDWSIRTNQFTSINDFEREVKKQIRTHKGTYEVVINKIIWKSEIDYKIFNKIYVDPITGILVFPTIDNAPKANEIYKYDIINNKAKLKY